MGGYPSVLCELDLCSFVYVIGSANSCFCNFCSRHYWMENDNCMATSIHTGNCSIYNIPYNKTIHLKDIIQKGGKKIKAFSFFGVQPQKHPILELKPLCENISNPIMIKRENKKKKRNFSPYSCIITKQA